jgi:hypothetical protein
LIGFYAALIPNLLAEDLHQTGTAVSGAIVFGVFVVSAVTVMATAGFAAKRRC